VAGGPAIQLRLLRDTGSVRGREHRGRLNILRVRRIVGGGQIKLEEGEARPEKGKGPNVCSKEGTCSLLFEFVEGKGPLTHSVRTNPTRVLDQLI